jgi:hypothetical protein
VVELHYNAICQYMGPGDSDEDWHMDHCPSLRCQGEDRCSVLLWDARMGMWLDRAGLFTKI